MKKNKKQKKELEKNLSEKTEAKEEAVPKKSWIKKEGELAVDVYGTEKYIIIQAPIAGVKREEVEVITEKDTIIIKGRRDFPQTEEIKNFYTKECFFGNFRREIILPEETDPSRIKAEIKEGVLVVQVPKIEREKRRKIEI